MPAMTRLHVNISWDGLPGERVLSHEAHLVIAEIK